MRWKPRAFVNQESRDRWVREAARRLPAGSRLLDVGAGGCRYRDLFRHCEYTSQDFCQYEGDPAWSYGKIDYVSDAAAIPAPDAGFDAILCTEVLEHVPDPVAVLRELARLLRQEGELYLTAPLGSGLHQEPYHFYGGFTPHFYHRFLPEAGFDVVSVEPNGGFFSWHAQETSRARNVLLGSRRYRPWHPAYWLAKVALALLRHWFVTLDDELMIEGFTVGYHVKARKRRAG